MIRIENNKARMSHRGNLFQKIKSFISPFRGIKGGILFPLLRGLKGTSVFPLWGIMGAFLLFSCLDDRDKDDGISPEVVGDPEVTLSVTIPGIHTRNTRGLSEADESTLETVHIFVFKDNGPGIEETYLYHTHATDIVGQGNQWNFKVYLQKSEPNVKHRIVLLANLKNEVEEVNYSFNTSQTKEEVLSGITFKTDVAWRTTDPVRTLPMWGQSDTTYLITGTTKGSDLPVIPLMRSVARIDVGVNLNTADQPQPLTKNQLVLKDVYLYNVKDKGASSPLDSCYDRSGGEDLKGIVTKPTIPVSAIPVTTPIRYTQDNPANVFFREIYLSEANNIAFPENAVSLVIGGYFTREGETPNTTQISYYRIDFYDTSKTVPERFDLLRNHRYRVNILAIRAEGYATKEMAIKEPPINIDVEIEVNEEGVILDMVYDGQHYLGINKALFTLPGEAWDENETDDTNLLIVNTSHPGGWKVASITDPANTPVTDWLKVFVDNGPAKTRTPVRLLLEENKTGLDRTGYIHLEAGELKHQVEVTQAFRSYLSVKDRNGVEIPDGDTLYYESGVMGTILAQMLDLEWSPGDLEVMLEEGIHPFTFDSSNDLLSDGDLFTGGYKTLHIRAAVMQSSEYATDPFLIKETKVTFRVAGTALTRTVILKQEKKGIVENACIYPLDGGSYSFTVKSNTWWNVSLATNNDGILTALQTFTGGNNTEGEKVHFRMDKVDQEFHGTATLTFSSPLGEFPDEVVTIRGGMGKVETSSNSYIVKPGTMGIRIPVSRANEYTTLQGEPDAIISTDILQGELLWTDNPNGISCESNVAFVSVSGSGSSGYIHIWPGEAEGNALVAVKVNGVIKWSWHIWVTHYDPEAAGGAINHYNSYPSSPKMFTIMDRNLGAISNTPGDTKSMGLHYQWSRKDPFPGGYTYGSEAAQPVYNATGELEPVPSSINTSIKNDLSYNIENPTVFTQGFSSGFTLWGGRNETEKTIYDPCPDGWRVPNTEGYRSPWYSHEIGYFSWIEKYGAFWNYGLVFLEDIYPLGYYPAAGVRTGQRVQLVGSMGRYWTSLGNGVAGAWLMELVSDDYDVGAFGDCDYGCSVRCIKVD